MVSLDLGSLTSASRHRLCERPERTWASWATDSGFLIFSHLKARCVLIIKCIITNKACRGIKKKHYLGFQKRPSYVCNHVAVYIITFKTTTKKQHPKTSSMYKWAFLHLSKSVIKKGESVVPTFSGSFSPYSGPG
jgi:hypothetical protein